MNGGDGHKRVRNLAVLLWVAGCLAWAASADAGKVPAAWLSATIDFRCLWWSENQMEGMDASQPPPKHTEVRLNKWEYSDPVGIPHPDVVDVVAEFNNTSTAAASNLVVTVKGCWRIGPLNKPSAARWSQWSLIKTTRLEVLQAGSSASVRVPLALAQKMEALHPAKLWPHRLRILCEAKTGGPGKSHRTRVRAELPIIPGD